MRAQAASHRTTPQAASEFIYLMETEENKKVIQAKGWLLEWKSNLPKEDALKKLLDLSEHIDNVRFAVLAKHKVDKDHYIRAFVQYERRVLWKPWRWDLGRIRGKYVTARSWTSVRGIISACNWITFNFNVEKALKKKKCRVPTLLQRGLL